MSAFTSPDVESLFNTIRESIIGEGSYVDGPFGKKLQTYVDYTASGKALQFIEDFLPLYANTHTESSYTGTQTNILREEARDVIKQSVHATQEHALIFTGQGVTSAIAKLISVLQLKQPTTNPRPVVFVGPYEHHSNEILWREADVDVVRISENEEGLADLQVLEEELRKRDSIPIKIGSFSAASNVTGIISDIPSICSLMHKYRGLCFVDYATGGPYLPILMSSPLQHDAPDAIFLSPHKFVGGPGTPGILVAKKDLFTNSVPTVPGGGTVLYTSPTEQVYDSHIETREEAGTPDIVGAIRAGLAFQVKSKIGEAAIHKIETSYARRAIDELSKVPSITLQNTRNLKTERLAILSFVIYHQAKAFHHNFIAVLLSDLFGIQARSGCSCAGPYGHSLLNVDEETSLAFKRRVEEGYLGVKPGWVRLNIPYWITEKDFAFILRAVTFVATYAHALISQYSFSIENGAWKHRTHTRAFTHLTEFQFGPQSSTKVKKLNTASQEKRREKYFRIANELLSKPYAGEVPVQEIPASFEEIRWFWLPHELHNPEAFPKKKASKKFKIPFWTKTNFEIYISQHRSHVTPPAQKVM